MVTFKNLEILGWFIWWTIRNVQITREDFAALLKQVGLKYELRPAKAHSTYLKAIARVQSEHRKDGLMIRPIKKRGEEYVHGLVDERVQVGEHLNYTHKANLRFFKNGTMVCDNPDHEAYKLVLQYFDLYSTTMDADDIREVLFEILGSTYSISVRQRGGIYFIPGEFSSVVEQLEQVIAGLGGDCYMAMAPQIDEEKTKKAVYKAFVEGLKERIAEFRKQLEANLTDTNISKDHVRYNSVTSRKQTALTARLSEYREMRKEIDFYADAMDFQAGALRTELEDLGTRLERKLSEE